jgi:hypothetical protein
MAPAIVKWGRKSGFNLGLRRRNQSWAAKQNKLKLGCKHESTCSHSLYKRNAKVFVTHRVQEHNLNQPNDAAESAGRRSADYRTLLGCNQLLEWHVLVERHNSTLRGHNDEGEKGIRTAQTTSNATTRGADARRGLAADHIVGGLAQAVQEGSVVVAADTYTVITKPKRGSFVASKLNNLRQSSAVAARAQTSPRLWVSDIHAAWCRFAASVLFRGGTGRKIWWRCHARAAAAAAAAACLFQSHLPVSRSWQIQQVQTFQRQREGAPAPPFLTAKLQPEIGCDLITLTTPSLLNMRPRPFAVCHR